MDYLYKLHDNLILTGSMDSFCLVCDNYLRSEDEAFTHIDKPIHKKNLGAATKVPKFLEDQIVKVKKCYYCPSCNILLSTTAKVTIHIGDIKHHINKKSQVLTRVGGKIIAFNEVLISEESWHGLMDDTCVICNIEFDDDVIHSMDLGHMLKLVQSKCEFGDQYIYRKVDDDAFFCLICGSVFAVNEKKNHHHSTSHINYYNIGKQLKLKVPLFTENKTKVIPSKLDITEKTNGEITEHDFKIQTSEDKKTNKIETNPIISLANHSPSNVNDSLKLQDGKITESATNHKELMTMVQNTTSNNLTKNCTKASEGDNKHTNETKSGELLDRINEFQKIGINVDLTLEIARCRHCNENVIFDLEYIEKHVEERHENKNNAEKKPESIEQVIKADTNNVKLDTNAAKTNTTVTKKDVNAVKATAVTNIVKPDTNEFDTDKKKIHTEDTKPDANKTQKNGNFDQTNNQIKIDIKHTAKQKPRSKKECKKLDKRELDIKKTEPKVSDPKPKQYKSLIIENKTDSAKTEANTNAGTNTEKKQHQKPKDHTKSVHTREELDKFAKENIVLRPNEAFCNVCNIKISLDVAKLEAHINSRTHRDKKPSQKMTQQNRVATFQYLESLIRLESNSWFYIILNNNIVLHQNSFHCIVMEDEFYKCMLCDGEMWKESERRKAGELTQHINSADHKNLLNTCMIVTSLTEEFVREISPELYHCGYCNVVTEGWTDLEAHLTRLAHCHTRCQALWNLERFTPVTKNARLMPISGMQAIRFS